jgi:ribosomal protein L18E
MVSALDLVSLGPAGGVLVVVAGVVLGAEGYVPGQPVVAVEWSDDATELDRRTALARPRVSSVQKKD